MKPATTEVPGFENRINYVNMPYAVFDVVFSTCVVRCQRDMITLLQEWGTDLDTRGLDTAVALGIYISLRPRGGVTISFHLYAVLTCGTRAFAAGFFVHVPCQRERCCRRFGY